MAHAEGDVDIARAGHPKSGRAARASAGAEDPAAAAFARLTSALAHEVRNPLNTLSLTFQFVERLLAREAKNLARDNRVSITVDHDTPDLMSITGLSMAARAHRVTDRAEAQKVLRMLPLKYPDAPPSTAQMQMPGPDDVALFRIAPEVISVLDYSQGFGHTDLVSC